MLEEGADSEEERYAADIADADDDPWDMVSKVSKVQGVRIESVSKVMMMSGIPGLVFGLPHERCSGVPDAVCGQHDRIRRDLLSVARSGSSNPRQSEDEAGGPDASQPLREHCYG